VKTPSDEAIARLLQAVELAFDLARSELAEIAAREVAIKRRISDLRANRSGGLTAAQSHFDARLMLSYMIWVDRQIASLNETLARIKVDRAAAQDRLRLAFGRRETARQVRKDATRRRIRREDQIS